MAEQPGETSATAIANPPNVATTDRTNASATLTGQPPNALGAPERPSVNTDPGKPAQADKDPMLGLLDHLQRTQSLIANIDRNLAHRILTLTEQGADPGRRSELAFRHQVAYAVQDLEKSLWPLPMTSELRSEMTRLAATAPGLENDRMRSLMGAIASLGDPRLIQDIRRAGMDISVQNNQDTPAIQSRIETLENRVRLSQRPAESSPDSGRPSSEHPQGATAARIADPPPPDNPLSQQRSGQTDPRGTLDTILRGMRPSDQGPAAPWDPPHTPMAGRLAVFESRMQESRDERALARAERSGRAALEALEAFRIGEGAIVMNRIREAARSEPGGLAAVLSEMHHGRRFVDLRQQFNNALETERGVTAAYDKAAAALARYGQDRLGIEQVIARRPDAANLSAKFEQMDAQIGEAAASTPSRRDGKSMVDDLAQKAAELVQRAVDAVKSAFNRSPSAEANTRAAPAPSMSV